MNLKLIESLKKINFQLSRQFIDPKNPFHKYLIKNLGKSKNCWEVFEKISKKYINQKFDICLPLAFSGVRISDEMPFLHYLENIENPIVKSYSVYRQGRLEQALRYIKNLKSRDATLLKNIILIYLKKPFKFNFLTEKKTLIKIKFLKNLKAKKFNKEDQKFYNYLAYKKTTKKFLNDRIISQNFNKYKKFICTDLNFLRNLAKKTKSSKKYFETIKKIYKSSKIPFTSEIMSGYLLSLHIEKNPLLKDFYNENLIILDRIKKSKIKIFLKNFDHFKRKLIHDFNTSNLMGRNYSPNLNYGYKINKNFQNYLKKIMKKYLKIYSNKLPFVKKLDKNNAHIWYDYSSNKKSSKITKHLHTAGMNRANIVTAVIYLQVPKRKIKKNGNLRIFDADIPFLDKYYQVKTGDVVFFPSYFFHETTKTNSKQLRKTLNIDYVVSMPKTNFL